MFFHPQDDALIIFGNSSNPIRVFYLRHENSEILIVPKNDTKKELAQYYSNNILSHCIVDDIALFGTDGGDILHMNKNLELKGKLSSSPTNEFEITCI